MINTVDTLDEKVLQILGKNARLSSEEMAKKLNVSPATIGRRVR